MDADIVILAGGQSRRMGRDKAQLLLAGKTLLAHALDNARTWGGGRILVAGAPRPGIEADYVPDAPGNQPSSLLGFFSGIEAAQADWVLVTGCDMPFISSKVVDLLWLHRGRTGAVAQWQQRLQPLPGLYARQHSLPVLESMLKRGKFHLAALLDSLAPKVVAEQTVAQVDARGQSFFNINCREDWLQAQRLSGSRNNITVR